MKKFVLLVLVLSIMSCSSEEGGNIDADDPIIGNWSHINESYEYNERVEFLSAPNFSSDGTIIVNYVTTWYSIRSDGTEEYMGETAHDSEFTFEKISSEGRTYNYRLAYQYFDGTEDVGTLEVVFSSDMNEFTVINISRNLGDFHSEPALYLRQ